MNDFHFANPEYGLLLLGLALLRWLLARLDRGARTRLLKFLARENLRQLLQRRSKLRERGKRLAFWIGLVCLIGALARPQANPTVEEMQSAGLDIYVLLDVSRSMDAEDIPPSRLKKAKRTVQHLTSRLSGDRVGIIAFANSALLLSPLTSDYSILDSYLQNVDTSVVPSQGTNLGHALEVAKEAMDRGAASASGGVEHHSNIFLVLSDGEDHGESDLSIVDAIHKAGGLVFTIAFGTEKGAPIPLRDDHGELRGYKKDRGGNVVVTGVKTAVLQEVAKRGGGQFYFSTLEEGEVEDILARVSDAQRGSYTSVRTVVYEELFWVFLLPGILALLFSFVPFGSVLGPLAQRLSRYRPRSAAPLALLVLGISPRAEAGALSLFWSKERRASEWSEQLAKQKKYSEAADALKNLQAENPDDPALNYDIGTYLLQDQKGRLGREQLSHLRGADGLLRDYALYNEAGSLATEGKKPEARAAYAELIQRLQRKPTRTESEAQLLEKTKRNVARLANPQQQPQPKPDKSDQPQEGGESGKGGAPKDQDKNEQKKDGPPKDKESGQSKGDQDKGNDKGKDKDNGKDKKAAGDENQDKDKGQDQKKDSEQKKDSGEQKDSKEKKDGGEQNKNDSPPRPQRGSQPFQERDNMGEDDAKRILGALKERESSLQKKFLNNKVKGGRVTTDDAAKDW